MRREGRAWWLLGAAAAILCSLFVVVPNVTTALEVAAGSTRQPDEPALLEELGSRLLARRFLIPDLGAPRVAFVPEALPPGLPDLPVPPGGRLVGSAMRTANRTRIDVVMDSPDPPSAVLDFYSQALRERGWHQVEYEPMPPLHIHPTLGPAAFCQGQQGPWLAISIFANVSGPTDVRIRVAPEVPGRCAPRTPGPPLGWRPTADPLPTLTMPDAVRALDHGGGLISPTRKSSRSTLQTDMGIVELEAMFAQQLQGAGWLRTRGHVSGPLAWSSWDIPAPGNWRGLLILQQAQLSGHYRLVVQVESPDAAESLSASPGR
jgi:hypothetical protein